MRQLQNISIQSKLIGIFVIVFLAGVAAIGWNTININRTKDDMNRVVTSSREKVAQALTASRDKVTSVSATSKETVTNVFDETDELLYLRVIQIEFRELEAIEKDFVLAGDPSDPQGMIPAHEEMSTYLQEDLTTARDMATNDHVQQVMGQMLDELKVQDDLFNELVTLVQTDPQAAQQRSLEGSARKADKIYNVLAELVNDQWDLVGADVDQTKTQMQDAVDQTSSQLETVFHQTDQQMQDVVDRTNSQMNRGIRLSLLTIALFVIAGALVAAVVLIVSHQIVQPVLEMSGVAEAIEKEEFQKTEQLDEIATRQDEIGQLARVFRRMAKEVFARVERLKQQVEQLRIVIDEEKMTRQVSEITDSSYFQDLQAKARTLRQQRAKPASSEKPPSTTSG